MEKDLWTASARGSWSISRYQIMIRSTASSAAPGLRHHRHRGWLRTPNPIPLTLNFYDINEWSAPRRIEAFTTANGQASTNIRGLHRAGRVVGKTGRAIGGARARPGASKEIVPPRSFLSNAPFRFENPLSVKLGYDYADRFRTAVTISSMGFVGADGRPAPRMIPPA